MTYRAFVSTSGTSTYHASTRIAMNAESDWAAAHMMISGKNVSVYISLSPADLRQLREVINEMLQILPQPEEVA